MPAILEDLEISAEDMLRNPKAFAERVTDKARELRKICEGGRMGATIEADTKERAAKLDCPEIVQKKLNELYSIIDELSTEEAFASIEAISKFREDVNYMVQDKLDHDIAKASPSIADRKVAHQQYISLRSLYGNFVSTISILDKDLAKRLPQMPALRGNYGGTQTVKRYLYVFDDQPDEEFWSPHAVIRKLGLSDKLKTFMDLMEYLEANPNSGVSVHERTL